MSGFTTASARLQSALHGEQVQQWLDPDGADWGCCFKDEAGYILRFFDLADFTVEKSGKKVTCYPTTSIDESTVEHLFHNHVAPLVSALSGEPVFHGCAVELDGKAAVFLGQSGLGKSTLALGFTQMGYRFLTDDGVKVRQSTQGWMVEPGHPSIRLWEDSFELQNDEHAKSISRTVLNAKRRVEANDVTPHSTKATPLVATYFLKNQNVESIEIEPVSGTDAAIAWVQNSFMLDPTDTSLVSRHFVHVSQIASSSPSFRVDYPRRFDALPDICKALIDHIEGIKNDY